MKAICSDKCLLPCLCLQDHSLLLKVDWERDFLLLLWQLTCFIFSWCLNQKDDYFFFSLDVIYALLGSNSSWNVS